MDTIISRRLSSDRLYAYHKNRFWLWDDTRGWKESHLMSQKFEREHAARPTLTPLDFMTDLTKFQQLDEFEIDSAMLDALKDARPCKAAPIEPVKEKQECDLSHAPTSPSSQEAPPSLISSVPGGNVDFSSASGVAVSAATTAPAVRTETQPTAPTFDFGADDQTNALLLQDAQTFITGNMARIMAAKHAHDLCANNKNGTWGKWCDVVGISRDTGDNMVHIAEQFGNIQIDGQSIFDVRPMKLLYAAAKPSTPQEVKQAVFSGDITTYKEYQGLMAKFKAEKERADAAEAREEEAWKLQSKAEAKAKDAETELEAVTADLNGLYDRAAQAEARNTALLDERDEHVRRIKELESRPIEVMHDPEETDRLAHQYAYGIAADMTEELRTQNNQQSQTIAALQKELEEARSTNGYDPQSDLETVCACIGSMEQVWGTALPAYERLTGKDLRTATDTLQDVIGRLYSDMARTAEDGED